MLSVKENALCLPQRPPSSPHPCGTHESLSALTRRSAWSDSSRDCQDGLCVLTTVLRWPSQAGLGGLGAWPRGLTCRPVHGAGARRHAQSSPGKGNIAGTPTQGPEQEGFSRLEGRSCRVTGHRQVGLQAAALSTPPVTLLRPAGSRGHVGGRGKGPRSTRGPPALRKHQGSFQSTLDQKESETDPGHDRAGPFLAPYSLRRDLPRLLRSSLTHPWLSWLAHQQGNQRAEVRPD